MNWQPFKTLCELVAVKRCGLSQSEPISTAFRLQQKTRPVTLAIKSTRPKRLRYNYPVRNRPVRSNPQRFQPNGNDFLAHIPADCRIFGDKSFLVTRELLWTILLWVVIVIWDSNRHYSLAMDSVPLIGPRVQAMPLGISTSLTRWVVSG